MRVTRWAQGRKFPGDVPTFRDTSSFMSIGVRGSGKSALLENIGLKYLNNGLGVIDLLSSRDGESLAWLKSPEIQDDGKRVLLLHGSNTSVAASYNTKPATNFKISDLDHYDVIISSGPLYSSIEQEFSEINTVIDECFRRHSYRRIFYVLCREAANIAYSRLRVVGDQSNIKAVLLTFVREMRHSGFSLGLDTLKVTSVDLDIRTNLDYLLLKSLGYLGLVDELKWLYSIYKPSKLQNMKPDRFIMVTKQGGTGVGWFPYHSWHKIPGEDILKEVGIDVEHGEELKPSREGKSVGDLEHVRIMELTLEGKSLRQIGAELHRNQQTVSNHIQEHNEKVAKGLQCERCSRAKSPSATQTIQKSQATVYTL